MIVKIQRPLFPPAASVLIYNKDRSFLRKYEQTPNIKLFIEFFMPDEAEIYCEAKDEPDDLKIIRRVADQGW